MAFSTDLVSQAQGQLDEWKAGQWKECGGELGALGSARIARYWKEGLGINGLNGCVDQPWSAAFICWCMRSAGMPLSDFAFDTGHHAYIRWAINNSKNSKPNKSYYGRRLDEYQPKPGDLIAQWRKRRATDPDPHITFDDQPDDFYPSHCDIVVQASATQVIAIGGNLSDKVSASTFQAVGGLLRPKRELICILECRRQPIDVSVDIAPTQRTWFARGMRGMIAKRIQTDLFRQGFVLGPPENFVDGDFGSNTENAITALQNARGLELSGQVDDRTWRQLTADPVPTLFERCLALTAAFEGHGFSLVQGNFDGAGLTWGIIGFTLASGEIPQLLREAELEVPGTLDRVMGALAIEWRQVVARSRAQQVAWADAMSTGPSKEGLPQPWKDAFAKLGDEPVVKRLQMHKAYDNYFKPAAETARRLALTTELGLALCFDMHVQNGTSQVDAVDEIESQPVRPTELGQRQALANAVADRSAPRWQADVRSRKLAIAQGTGTVHGRVYRLASWGLTDVGAG